jgi:hypothetical protein
MRGVWSDPNLHPERERLHLELEIALGAGASAAEPVEAPHDERRVARFVEVLPKGRLDDGARRDASRRAVGSELLGKGGGVDVRLKPGALVSADFAHGTLPCLRATGRGVVVERKEDANEPATRFGRSVSATGQIEECTRPVPARGMAESAGLDVGLAARARAARGPPREPSGSRDARAALRGH